MLLQCLDQGGPELVMPHPVHQHHFHPTSAILTVGLEELCGQQNNEFVQLKTNLTQKKEKTKIKL